MKARGYQKKAVDALVRHVTASTLNPLIVMPTASGKSVVIASFVQRLLRKFPLHRVLILAHKEELVRGNQEKMASLAPEVDAGIYCAGLGRSDTLNSVIFASIGSVYRRSQELGTFDFVIIDEAHTVPASKSGMYVDFVRKTEGRNDKVIFIGFTATPFRQATGCIINCKNNLFEVLCHEVFMDDLLKEGYLSPLISGEGLYEVDLSSITATKVKELEEQNAKVFGDHEVTNKALNSIKGSFTRGSSVIAFCSGVDHAIYVRDYLEALGLRSDAIHCNTPSKERKQAIKDITEGRTNAICNADTLTTGTDIPRLNVIIILRKIGSVALYVQIMGRGMRLFPGKECCYVYDFGGNVERHGTVNKVRPWIKKERKKEEREEDPPVKMCPECFAILPVQIVTCECGYAFGEGSSKHEKEHYSGDINSGLPPIPKVKIVASIFVERHVKLGSPDSLKVSYLRPSGTVILSEFICLEFFGPPQKQAEMWWAKRANGAPPKTVSEALRRQAEIRAPKGIETEKEDKYLKILRYFDPVSDQLSA